MDSAVEFDSFLANEMKKNQENISRTDAFNVEFWKPYRHHRHSYNVLFFSIFCFRFFFVSFGLYLICGCVMNEKIKWKCDSHQTLPAYSIWIVGRDLNEQKHKLINILRKKKTNKKLSTCVALEMCTIAINKNANYLVFTLTN